ncbi:MAG: ATP cone domain-containing protein [Candidatus Amesbacteria bacterium]|nr:ATP cone domain-containing protein [Candidatus Amesbacteria bacterium]
MFTSMEKITLGNLKVTKKSGIAERYDSNKIFLGIFRAVNESKWISRNKARIITKIVTDKAEQELIKLRREYISSKQIGGIVLKVLKVASNEGYLRFLPYFKRQSS